jgi:hypothetical protein
MSEMVMDFFRGAGATAPPIPLAARETTGGLCDTCGLLPYPLKRHHNRSMPMMRGDVDRDILMTWQFVL